MTTEEEILTKEEDISEEIPQEQVDNEVTQLVPIAVEAVKENKVGDYQGNIKDRFQEEMQLFIVRYTWRRILGNLWCNGVCWGQSRVGKTSAIMRLGNTVYHDWDMVLRSIAFGLNSIVWKMDHKIPLTILERVDRIYNRVPFLLSDDSGSCDNKSITQNDESFNYLKGSIDLWGTRLACLWHTLNQPNELTLQLASKYTCELYIEQRGIGKIDTVKWQPNFKGWIPNPKKRWKQSFKYGKVPIDVYKQYALTRDEMIDTMNQRFQDKRADTLINKLLQRCEPVDFQILQTFKEKGSITSYMIEQLKLNKDAVFRCKNRELLESTPTESHHYKYDISQLGLELLRVKQIVDNPEEVKKEYRKND